jgi:hypothetical protein
LTTIALISAFLGVVGLILKIYLRTKEDSPFNQKKIINDVFKEEERRRAERLLRNELKTLAINDNDIIDELKRIRDIENNE